LSLAIYGFVDINCYLLISQGVKLHNAQREEYGEGYKSGDVIGFYIYLPSDNSV
jgi:hypothetical protein